eukprot:753015-Hanusia_phi.AAC.1
MGFQNISLCSLAFHSKHRVGWQRRPTGEAVKLCGARPREEQAADISSYSDQTSQVWRYQMCGRRSFDQPTSAHLTSNLTSYHSAMMFYNKH